MSMENQPAGEHRSMSELFRAEVAAHTATLQQGLSALQDQTTGLETLEPMLKAIHAIWGGAKLIDFDLAAQLAHSLEMLLRAVQKGQTSVSAEIRQLLAQGIAALAELGAATPTDLTAWPSAQQAELTHLIAALKQGCETASATTSAIAPLARQAEVPPAPSSEAVAVPAAKAAGAPPGGMTDEAMLELFRAEVEMHTATIADGLLVLEATPGALDQLEALMRAAHSIKGAARVVDLDAVVQIAHVMEDCFVAAQQQTLVVTSDQIDLFLQGVDLMQQISEAVGGATAQAWLTAHAHEVQQLCQQLAAILRGETPVLGLVKKARVVEPPVVLHPTPRPPAVAPARLTAPTAPANPEPLRKRLTARQTDGDNQDSEAADTLPRDKDRMVRVTAAKIERLMGLGGEVVVSTRWLPPFSESLLGLKKNHNELFALLEKLQDTLGEREETRQFRELAAQAREKTRECNRFLAERLNQLDMFVNTSANLSDRLYHEVIGVRMRPFSDGIRGFPRLVRDLAKKLGKKVTLEIQGKATEVDRDILEKLDAPLTHLMRNALDHGIEAPAERLTARKPEIGMLRLEAAHRAGMLMISVADDGRGINLTHLRAKILEKKLIDVATLDDLTEAELLEFLFLPGFSTAAEVTEISGRGVGLDVVHDMVHEVGGVVRATTTPGKGTTFHLELPLTLSVIRTFLVEIAGEPYAFPLARIDRCLIVREEELETVEDRQYFRFDNINIALVDIHEVLEINAPVSYPDGLTVVVLSDRNHSYGLLVDKFVGEYDLVVRPLDVKLGKVQDISAVAVMLDGSPVLIFDVEDMLRSIDKMLNKKRLRKVSELLKAHDATMPSKRILVVDDSITVREMERKLLENHGYVVELAVDGMDGWNAVRTANFDLIVSDIDMPRMNGIEFIKNIKQHDDLKTLPVIIVSYKDTQEHRLQGLEAGANYYLTKSSFEDDSFINAIVDLIGEAN